jgi:hypothetical protein
MAHSLYRYYRFTVCIANINYITNSTVWDLSGKTDTHSAEHGISRILWKKKVHYNFHRPLQDLILSELNPVFNSTPYFIKINFDIMPTHMLR